MLILENQTAPPENKNENYIINFNVKVKISEYFYNRPNRIVVLFKDIKLFG